VADFIRVVRFCVEKINSSDEARPEISSEDLRSQLDMQPLSIRKMYLLLQWEPNIMGVPVVTKTGGELTFKEEGME
jgi:hypothetical protein